LTARNPGFLAETSSAFAVSVDGGVRMPPPTSILEKYSAQTPDLCVLPARTARTHRQSSRLSAPRRYRVTDRKGVELSGSFYSIEGRSLASPSSAERQLGHTLTYERR
jgi:hypothetical protein